jgi:tyrosine phenol-lyase
MSDRQWAGMMLGDEAYAGSRNYYHLEEAIQNIYGYKYIVPPTRGAARNTSSPDRDQKRRYVPGNMYFTTTRLHQELAGGTFVDVIIDEAHDPNNLHPFKGNVDLNKVEDLINRVGAENPLRQRRAGTVNMAGGQPVSMENLRPARTDPNTASNVIRRHPRGRKRLLHPGTRRRLRR